MTLVIFLFLGSLRATIVASIAVPLSLIGAFAAMWAMGFSINNLSLMALTIASGFVVDDAIVVLENIARHIEEGMQPFDAALRGASEIGFTIIILTVSLIAVLIPLLFMGDVVGRLFREFAVTLAVTIVLSAVVALTLVPMLAARWLKPARGGASRSPSPSWTMALVRLADATAMRVGLDWVLRAPGADPARVRRISLALTALLFLVIPKDLFPEQDTGQIAATTVAPAADQLRGAWRRCSSRPRRRCSRIRRWRACPRRSASTAINPTLNQGRLTDQPQAARASAPA